MKKFLLAATALVGLVSVHSAQAAYVGYGGVLSDYVPNSATAAYLAAQGAPTEFVSFDTLAAGGDASESPVDGSVFSYGVSFASLNSPQVNWAIPADPGNSEIGPLDLGPYSGTLVITLAVAVSAVGFGTVEATNVTFYDSLGQLVGVASTSDPFEFVGLIGSGGSDIKTIDISGDFFAIQDFQYASATATPEPASMALLGAGLLGLGAVRRKRI